ncbi:MAG: tRNA 2-selenouridine(34) synthase MnmH [Oceanospirillaceae bacterium]|uniref:tRNA 2-selenouridine(34) synthase MnmH n=1 Tax=unclassified Thalassolituus TaxID=2624967 RepID=UPI000C0A7B54|nr:MULTISPECIES: tRNA 2-selenouridine(34) synthase MnmH [unclassified Thalassolituus]MAK91588.1 tRNA 2-selenouridine(34) synthase MnmH [Thalassolituus sp.]MAS25830.1 tRNA 2-selenouridine(34) synthase MnmH [Oceanospirillaceae bacterium]MAY00122.1 tRNA 2-selenouridine(34) synthase MnmH [Oceanospirillaceae bacterium]MBL35727.1 tRNA 2-selenouridine(34) synthase MnmH [Oceanospirillaceae bacterium]|tara:strand:- start:9732 stop:10829 length:1098 start_codon:yes stop_codon:yes gene_type:complete
MSATGDSQVVDNFAEIFLRDTPMFDTRAPLEYKKGSFPFTASLPLMTDQERAKVGTCYKRDGQDAAIKLGHQLVSGKIKEERLQQWLDFARAHPDGYLFCWRGGLRSQTVQQWMRDAGVNYPRIKGGYKALRRFLIDAQERIVEDSHFRILAGNTGCAKTDLLNRVDNSIDLEGIANHLGSTFGKRPDGQPSQIDFENKLAIALFRQNHAAAEKTILLEDESMLIGRCAIPENLRKKMAESPLIVVQSTLEERIEHSFRNYILHKLEEWQRVAGDEAGFQAFADDLTQSMYKIRKRLGGVRYQQLSDLLQQALREHQAGDNSLHREWISILLSDYYDPMYDYQMTLKKGPVEFRGTAAEITEYLA